MILRVFHPIGQGAFYSERHPGFNFVYDCGSLGSGGKARGNKLISESFEQTSEIAILCISHFDLDHINHIVELRNKFRIKRVVLPLLHKDEKLTLTSFHLALGTDKELIELIADADAFFNKGEEETVIIYIKPYQGENEGEIGAVDLNSLQASTELSSAVRLNMKDHYWQYRPFNIEHEDRKRQLLEQFRDKGLNINKFKTDVKYFSDPDEKEVLRKIKEIYKDIEGSINNNSMFVYSGPFSNKNHAVSATAELKTGKPENKNDSFMTYQKLGIDNSNPACIYTGDGDLNIFDIKKHYRSEWNLVGTIQVPHHGSLKSFNTDVLERNLAFPVSYGSKNHYGHPAAPIINAMIRKGCTPYLVTEESSTTYFEIILPTIQHKKKLNYQTILILWLKSNDIFLCQVIEAICNEPLMKDFLEENKKGFTFELFKQLFSEETDFLKTASCSDQVLSAFSEMSGLLDKYMKERKKG